MECKNLSILHWFSSWLMDPSRQYRLLWSVYQNTGKVYHTFYSHNYYHLFLLLRQKPKQGFTPVPKCPKHMDLEQRVYIPYIATTQVNLTCSRRECSSEKTSQHRWVPWWQTSDQTGTCQTHASGSSWNLHTASSQYHHVSTTELMNVTSLTYLAH